MASLGRSIAAVARAPVIWGALASAGFYGLIHFGPLNTPFMHRYFAGHWVEYVEVVLFFWGLAALLVRWLDALEERPAAARPHLPPHEGHRLEPTEAPTLVARLDELPRSLRQGRLADRLRAALDLVHRQGSAEKLHDDLRFLSEQEAIRINDAGALVRLVIWAIPILGFLGTVIGITMAISSLDPKQLEGSLAAVTLGLGTAFDTTALALGLSMVLMFVQYRVDKAEQAVLSTLDERAEHELAGRFELDAGSDSTAPAAVKKVVHAVALACGQLVEKQADLWRESLQRAEAQWSQATAAAQQQLLAALKPALESAAAAHADRLQHGEAQLAAENRKHWQRLQETVAASTAHSERQQAELRKQSEALLEVVRGAGEITRLQQALEGNLASLSASQHLEETLLGLTGALNLLHARLSHLTPPSKNDGREPKNVGRAA